VGGGGAEKKRKKGRGKKCEQNIFIIYPHTTLFIMFSYLVFSSTFTFILHLGHTNIYTFHLQLMSSSLVLPI
jgi:hypothetical protein